MSIIKRLSNIIKSNINDFVDNVKSPQIDSIQTEFVDYQDNPTENTTQTYQTITPDKKEIEYYANLELPYGASFSDIKKSYRTLLKKYHPDLYAQDDENKKIAEKITLKLNESMNYFEEKFSKGEPR